MPGKSIKIKERGFSTLELMIAMIILVMALTAVMLIVFGNQSIALDNQVNAEALIKINDMLEKAKSQARIDFFSLANASASDDIYKKELMVTDVNACKKTAIASISWHTDSRPINVRLDTTLVNQTEAIALGGDCGPDNPPSTGWQNIVCENPNSPTWDFSPGGPAATGLDLIERGSNRYVAITENASTVGDSDFWIVNVNNRASLDDVGSVDTGTGLNDVDVAGNYAYVANDATTRQLQVINITNLSAPSLIASASLNTSGSGSEAQTIFYHDKKVYIGTNYIAPVPKEFQVFDVSNPASPFLISGGTYNVNHNVYDIIVRDEVVGGVVKKLAYLAVSDADGDEPKMIVLDVTNPSAITLFGSYSPMPNDKKYGIALSVLGENAYLGRQRVASGVGDLVSLNISNPALPTHLDSEILGMASGDEVRGIVASGNLLFEVNTDNNKGFQVWDVANPKALRNIANCKYPQDPVDMKFDGNFIYVINEHQDALRIIYDASNPFP